MTMREVTEHYETQAAARRTAVQFARNYVILSKIFKPIVKMGGEKVDKRIHKIAQFWAAVDCGKFVVEGQRYKLRPSGEGFQIVAV